MRRQHRLFSRCALLAYRTLGSKIAVNDSQTIQDFWNRTNSSKSDASQTSQSLLAQHYAKTAYALPAHSSKPAYRRLGGKHTIIATPQPSRAPGIFQFYEVRRLVA